MNSFGFLRGTDSPLLLGYYAASIGNFLPAFWGNLSVPSSMPIEDGTDRLSRNVGNKLPLLFVK